MRRPGRGQVPVRVAVVAGVGIALVATYAAGAAVPAGLTLLLLGLAGVVAVRPETPVGGGVLVATALLWLLVPRSPLILLAAAGLVLSHVAMLLAAQGPSVRAVPAALLRRWVGRGALVWAASVPVWALGSVPFPRSRWVLAAALLALGVLAVASVRPWRRTSGGSRDGMAPRAR